MKQLTLTLTGNSSSLSADYYPPIELDDNSEYVIGLIDFTAYNSIANITGKNNKLHIRKYYLYEDEHSMTYGEKYTVDWVVKIEIGSYEMKDLLQALNNKLANFKDFVASITVNEKTMKSMLSIKSDANSDIFKLDFSRRGSIGSVLGFLPRIVDFNNAHPTVESDHLVNINSVNVLRIECNLAGGSFINHKSTHTIHEFWPEVPAGYKIVEVPRNIIYMPVIGRTIHHLNLKIVDQDGDLVDFRGETITCRVHIKKLE